MRQRRVHALQHQIKPIRTVETTTAALYQLLSHHIESNRIASDRAARKRHWRSAPALDRVQPYNRHGVHVGIMNSTSIYTAALSPNLSRRPSISSRVSFAVSNAEQGEASREGQIDDEIAEIKRYEVSECVLLWHMYLLELTPHGI